MNQAPQHHGERHASDEENDSPLSEDGGHFFYDPDNAYIRFSGVRSHSCDESINDGNCKCLLVVLLTCNQLLLLDSIAQTDIGTPGPDMEDDVERHSLPPEIISSHLDALSRSGLHVNLDYKLVICLECSQAVHHSLIQGHVSQHNLPRPSTDELAIILEELDLTAPPPFSSSDVIAPIVGLELVDGFVCLAESCGIAVGSKTSLQRHRAECHMNATVSSEPCKIHRIFGFKGNQLVVRVDPNLDIERPHGTFAEYMSLMRPKENRSLLPLNPSNDARKTTGFLQRSRWLQVVSGHSTQELLSLVAIPAHGDALFPIIPVVKTMFKRMWDDVESMEVLPRRHIHTPKG